MPPPPIPVALAKLQIRNTRMNEKISIGHGGNRDL